MKDNIKRVKYSGEESENGTWWKWNEYCDKCGIKFRGMDTISSCPPNTQEADFCLNCMRELMQNNISYTQAKKLYK